VFAIQHARQQRAGVGGNPTPGLETSIKFLPWTSLRSRPDSRPGRGEARPAVGHSEAAAEVEMAIANPRARRRPASRHLLHCFHQRLRSSNCEPMWQLTPFQREVRQCAARSYTCSTSRMSMPNLCSRKPVRCRGA